MIKPSRLDDVIRQFFPEEHPEPMRDDVSFEPLDVSDTPPTSSTCVSLGRLEPLETSDTSQKESESVSLERSESLELSDLSSLSPHDREFLNHLLSIFDGDVVESFGPKRIGPLTSCTHCATGTWVRYGSIPLCRACARKRGLPW